MEDHLRAPSLSLGAGSLGPGAPVVVEEASRSAWESFAEDHPQATACHLWGWREVLENTFGHRGYYLLARRDGRICGALPLISMRSILFGRFLSSVPYLNYGGFLATDPEVEAALLAEAVKIARSTRSRSIEFRHVEKRSCPEEVKSHKVTMLLGLTGEEKSQWEAFPTKIRTHIRKATRSGLKCEPRPDRDLEDFYRVFARNMRDLGTPVYPLGFFRRIRDAFPDRCRILVVRKEEQPLAAGLVFTFADRMEIPWSSAIRDYNPLCPNNLLYWEAIRLATQRGLRVFDMGRSSPNEGTYRFKEQWGARPVPLHWQYWLAEGETLPDRSPKNRRFGLCIRGWQKLPLWVAGSLGPILSRNLP